MMVNGIMINVAKPFEQVDAEWALQLSIYSWLLGAPVGEDMIAAIDQLACNGKASPVEIRVASHRAKISPVFQREVFTKAAKLWNAVHSNHLFTDLSTEASNEKCQQLEEKAKLFAVSADSSAEERWFASACR